MRTRLHAVLLVLLSLLSFSLAFEPGDHQIFKLRDEVIQAEGSDATFYSFLNISETASNEAIGRALKSKSKKLHPDRAIRDEIARRTAKKAQAKNERYDPRKKPGVRVTKGLPQKERDQIAKEANDRYARVANIAKILQSPDRERYDYFLKNGFPLWRGSGYYYDRFRPGLGSVLFGLFVVFGGAAHYGAMYLSWKRQREFVERYVSHARKTAWGNDSGIPGIPGLENITNPAVPSQGPVDDADQPIALNRRQKRMQEKESKKKENRSAAKGAKTNGISRPVGAENVGTGPQGSRKKVKAENGKMLIVDSVGNVFLEDDTEEGEVHEFLLDPNEIPKPTIYQTALFRLPIFLYSQSIGRVVDKIQGTSEAADEPLLDADGAELTMNISSQADEDDVLGNATAINANYETRKRKSKAKA